MAKLLYGKGVNEIKEVSPQNGKDFKLQEVHKLLNIKNLKIINLGKDYLGNSSLMLIDDDGRLKDGFINGISTILAWQCGAIPKNDCIRGNTLICNENEFLEK